MKTRDEGLKMLQEFSDESALGMICTLMVDRTESFQVELFHLLLDEMDKPTAQKEALVIQQVEIYKKEDAASKAAAKAYHATQKVEQV